MKGTMMKNRVAHILSTVLFSVVMSGCATTTSSNFYTLDAKAKAADALPAASSYAVLVGPVTVPDMVNRPQMVVQVAPNRVEMNDFNRWAGALDDAIARVVAEDLTILLGTSDVATAPLANFNPAFRVTINIQRFESVAGKEVVNNAVWTVSTTATSKTISGHSIASESVDDMSFEALAAAHSRALARVSSDIAAAIRSANASL